MNTRKSVLTTTFIVGLVCAGYASYHLYRNWTLTDHSERTTATVMYLDRTLSTIGGEISEYDRANEYSESTYKTVVYHTKGGEKIVWQSWFGVEGNFWDDESDYEDQTAAIVYDPADPDYWEYDNFTSMFVNWFALLLGGLALMSLWFGPYDAIVERLRETDDEREAAVASIRETVYSTRPAEHERDKEKNEENEEEHFSNATRLVPEPATPLIQEEMETYGTLERDSEGFDYEHREDPFANMR